jgi:hypothetical protein
LEVVLSNHLKRKVTLNDVLLVPDLSCNLISLSKADDAGHPFSGHQETRTISSGKRPLLTADKHNSLCHARCTPILPPGSCTKATPSADTQSPASPSAPPAMHEAKTDVSTANANAETTSAVLWHRRLGHVGYSTLARMSRGLTVRGLPSAPLFEAQLRSSAVCTPCACGKMKRESFPLSGVLVAR